MRLLKIMLIALILSGVSSLAPGCSSGSASTPEGQVAIVLRGDLSTAITGVGNLALSKKVDLAFEMEGTVQEVLVKEAQSVEEGKVLARLDTSAWEEQVTALEDKITTAERAVTKAQRTVTDRERAVTQAQRTVTDRERDVTKAERAVTAAEQNVVAKKRDLLQAQINLNNAQLSLEQTEETSTDPLEIELKQLAVELARGKLADAQQAVADAATTGIADAKQAVEDAKVRVDDAKQAVEDAKVAVEDAKIAVEDAKKALADAQKALADAQAASPEVKAPFAGFITKVNLKGGDDVKKGTVAMTIADPNKFEAEVMVSEKNFPKVKLGGAASVQVEALQGVILPATITQLAPSATIQSGVVNYKVKVEVTSLQTLTQQQAGTAATENVSPSAPAGRFGQAGRQQPRTGQAGQTSGALTGNAQLAEGMTVTVSILTAQKNDVLLVPVQAIVSRSGETIVQVSRDGVTEERPVQVGLSNWQYAEITSGLSEGEQVIIPRGTTTTTTSPTTGTQQQRQGQTGIVPGIQRMLR